MTDDTPSAHDQLASLRALIDDIAAGQIAPPPATSPKKVDFGNKADPQALVGRVDPLEGTPLAPGEHAILCGRCGTAYHLTTMPYLRSAGRGKCVSCGTADKFVPVVLPGAPAMPAPTPPVETEPAPVAVVAPPVAPIPAPAPDLPFIEDAAGRPIIRLGQVLDFVDQEVAFEGHVHEVRRTGGGAIYIYFQPPRHVLDGFRGTIRPQRLFDWQIEGIDPQADYVDHWVRMTGVVTNHPTYRLQMVLSVPEQIARIDGPTPLPFIETSEAPAAPEVPEPAAPPEPDPAPAPPRPRTAARPRVRWTT